MPPTSGAARRIERRAAALVKVVALVASTLLVAVMLGGATGLLVSVAPDPDSSWLALAGASVGLLLFGPLLLGALRSSWSFVDSDASRTTYRRWLVGIVVAEAVAAVGLCWYVVASRSPFWAGALIVAVGVVATLVAPRIGDALRRHGERVAPTATPAFDDARARRATRAMVGTFAVTLAIAAIVLLAVDASLEGELGIGASLLFAVGFAVLASAIAGTIGALPAHRRLRAIVGGDLGRARRYARTVLRGKHGEVADDERDDVLEYARVVASSMGLQGASTVLLAAGLGLQQLVLIAQRPDDAALQTFSAIALGIVVVVSVPLTIVQVRRARRYVAAHASP